VYIWVFAGFCVACDWHSADFWVCGYGELWQFVVGLLCVGDLRDLRDLRGLVILDAFVFPVDFVVVFCVFEYFWYFLVRLVFSVFVLFGGFLRISGL